MTVTAALLLAILSAPAQGPSTVSEAGLAPAATVRRLADLAASGDPDTARLEAGKIVASYPDDPAVRNLAGVIDARRGADADAERHFEAAIRLAPRAVAPRENLARLYLERSGADASARGRAIETYAGLLAIDPAHADALYQSAFLLALDGRFAEAKRHLDALPSTLGERPQVLALVASALAGLGDASGASAVVSRMASHPGLAAADVIAVLPALDRAGAGTTTRAMIEALDARGLATPALLHRLGRIHAADGRFDEAVRVLDRAAAAAPSARVLQDLARASEKLGRDREALGYLAHARALDANDALTHFLFGMICVKLELGAEAYESLTKAAALAPDNALIHYALGAVSMHRHEPAEAIPHFEHYVRLQPKDVRGRFALGAARFHASQFDRARQDLAEAARAPETAAGAHYYLARIARQANDLETADRELSAALRAEPRHADALAELGLVRMRQERYAEAERALDDALAIDPDHYAATVNMATLFARTRDPRREAQAARLAALQKRREADAQDFLRIIEVVP